jgi:hypothetical protein
MSYLITDRKYKGSTKLCLLSGQIPKDIDKDWYIKNILNQNIQSVCSLKLVKTESGERRKLLDVIIPEILAKQPGEVELSEKRIEDLMILLRPIYKKTGNLIKGSISYIRKWSLCVSNPNWFKCLTERLPNYSLQNHITVLKTISQYQDVNRMSQGLGISLLVTLELLTNLYKYITTYFTVQDKERI